MKDWILLHITRQVSFSSNISMFCIPTVSEAMLHAARDKLYVTTALQENLDLMGSKNRYLILYFLSDKRSMKGSDRI